MFNFLKKDNQEKNDLDKINKSSPFIDKNKKDPLKSLLTEKDIYKSKEGLLQIDTSKFKYSYKKKIFHNLLKISKNLLKYEKYKEMAYLEYYCNLYEEKNPNLNKLEELLIKYGAPDILNPYNKNMIEFNEYKFEHIMGRDLEYIMAYITYKIDNGVINLKEMENNFLTNEKEHIFQILNNKKNNYIDTKFLLTNYYYSIHAYALIISYTSNRSDLEHFFYYFDEENIQNITHDCILNIDPEFYNINTDLFYENIIKLNIFSQKNLDFILALKKM